MSVAILIVTHPGIGKVMLDTAVNIIGSCPLPAEVCEVQMDCNTDTCFNSAREQVQALNQGDGVLVLTDLYGSTPSNIANTLHADDVMIVTGVNLPMLIRLLNYPNLPLSELASKAVSGGKDGVLICPGNNHE